MLPIRRLATVAAALCLIAVPTAASAAGPEGNPVGDHGYTARIQRTEYGIPHIRAADFGGLGYGYGYAFAQDNLCAMADQVLTLRGERSRYLGPTATSNDVLAHGTTNLASDTYHQGLRQAGTVQRLLDRPAPLGPTEQVRRLVDGYVAGYNRYLRDTGVAKLPDPTCRGKDWVGPITALDVWTGVYEFGQVEGVTPFRQDIATATPPAPTNGAPGVGAPRAEALPALPALPKVLADDTGSNGWALGRDATRAHDAMLLANPHLPWIANARLYQVQLTIPGVLDVSGASFYGSPVVELGHNRSLAWTHTADHSQHASVYRLSLVPGDPTSYLVDGKAVPMTRQTVPVTVRGADGKLSTVTSTLYASRYGPVLGTHWTATTAYAVRDANADNLRSVNEWLAMGSSQNLAQLQSAQHTYQGMPWMYTFAVDTSGTTYFTDSSRVPHLTDAQGGRCILQADPERADIVDGSTAACDWGSDPDAVEPGVFGPGSAPTLTRTDYLANSNNSPLYTNPAAPLTGYPGVYDSRSQLELRPQLGLQMIAGRLDGGDGLGAPGFTLPTLQAAMFGDRNYSGEFGRDAVVALCRADPALTARDGTTVDVRAACAALAGWDLRDDADSHGAVLWAAFFSHLLEDFPSTWWQVPYDPAHPVTTPRGINGNDVNVRTALADAVQGLTAGKVPLDAAPGSLQRWAGIPLPGCGEEQGCFNVVAASPTSGHAGGVELSGGNMAQGTSFVMAAELTPDGPRTRTVLSYGESANPASPHYSDQTALFSHRQWVTERFTEAEITADPQLRTTTLHG